MQMNKLRCTACVVAIALILLSTSAIAVVINSTKVAGNQLTITGTGFSAIPLTVTFNTVRLTVLSSSATQVVATLNPVPAPGNYRLIVKSGTASANTYVTISAPALLIGFCEHSSYAGAPYYISIPMAPDTDCNTGASTFPTKAILLPSDGILSSLTAKGQFTGPGTVAVWINEVKTALSCTISNLNGNASCSDKANQILVKAGDNLAVTIITNTATYIEQMQVALAFTAN